MLADMPLRRGFRAAPGVVVALMASTIFFAGCLSLPSPTVVSPPAPSPVTKGTLGLTIVHSNDTWGYLAPCG